MTDTFKAGTHVRGLRCPECGHTWPGHARVGHGYAICPECLERLGDVHEPRARAGEVYEGTVETAGCDRHLAPLPCWFCG